MRPFGVICALLLLIAAGARLVSADTAEESGAPDSGEMLIGWIAEAITVEEFLTAHPQVQSISVWDADHQRYRTATPAAPGSLDSIKPGMAIVIRFGDEQAIELPQVAVADGEQIHLFRGRNLVAWTGPSKTPINLAVRSIGPAFERALVFDAETREFDEYQCGSDAEDSRCPLLNRGDVFWVYSSSDVYWLQASGDRPLYQLTAPPKSIGLDPFYQKYLDADGVLIYSSAKVADEALFRAAAIIDDLLVNRPDVRKIMAQWGLNVAIAGQDEATHELPDFSYVKGSDRYVFHGPLGPRGLGPRFRRPMLISEEDTLCLASDRTGGDTALHEVAHAIEFVSSRRSGGQAFKRSLEQAYRAGLASGVWNHTYAATNVREFWAEGVQIWFGLNGPPGRESSWIDTRTELQRFAPSLARLIDAELGEVDLTGTCHVAVSEATDIDEGLTVAGRVLVEDEDRLFRTSLHLEPLDSGLRSAFDRVEDDGSFLLRTYEGNYRLRLSLDGCSLYYGEQGLVTSPNDAEPIAVTDAHIDGLSLEPSDHLCTTRYEGRIVDKDGVGIEDIRVTLSKDDASVARATTDERGKFQVALAETGEYGMHFSLGPCRYYYGSSGLSAVKPEAGLLDVDETQAEPIDIRIPAGFCEATIRGAILDSEGRGFGNLRVSAHSGVTRVSTRTSPDGSYSLTPPLQGEYRVYVNLGSCWVYYSGDETALRRSDAQLVPLGEHDVIGIDLSIPDWACNQIIKGRLLDADGQPIEDAHLRVSNDEHSASDRSDSEGWFDVRLPEPGEYLVRISTDHCIVYEGESGTVSIAEEAQRLVIGSGALVEVEIKLSDQACKQKISGVLLDDTGQPIEGETVLTSNGRFWRSNVTDADGSFEFRLPEPGEYHVTVNLGSCWVYHAEGGPTVRDRERGLWRLEVGDSLSLDFTIPSWACSQTIAGKVVDFRGQPLEDVAVTAGSDFFQRTRRTDAEGSFAITVSEPGAYELRANLGNCWVYYAGDAITVRRAKGIPVDVTTGETLFVELRVPEWACNLSIQGRLLNASGEPIASRWIVAHSQGSFVRQLTNAEGVFELTVAEPDSYVLSTSVESCTTYYVSDGATSVRREATEINVDAGSVTGLRFRLPEWACGYTISGVLLDADGIPLRETRVSAGLDSGNRVSSTTDISGTFAIRVPNRGTYRLAATRDGCSMYYRQNQPTNSWARATRILVSDSNVTDIRFQLARNLCQQRISGRLLNADGSGRPRVWIDAIGHGGEPGAYTDSDGSFRFSVPRPGSYRVRAWVDGCLLYRSERGATTTWDGSSRIFISSTGRTGLVFQLPKSPSSLCD